MPQYAKIVNRLLQLKALVRPAFGKHRIALHQPRRTGPDVIMPRIFLVRPDHHVANYQLVWCFQLLALLAGLETHNDTNHGPNFTAIPCNLVRSLKK